MSSIQSGIRYAQYPKKVTYHEEKNQFIKHRQATKMTVPMWSDGKSASHFKYS